MDENGIRADAKPGRLRRGEAMKAVALVKSGFGSIGYRLRRLALMPAVLVAVSCVTYREPVEPGDPLVPVRQLVNASVEFHGNHERWPETVGELDGVAGFDPAALREVRFEPVPDGSVRVEWAAHTGHSGGLTLQQPPSDGATD